ncbi:MAG: hypothetical protein CVU10_09625 [Bacteroidetes bacterium HGW-Bacteroidetes-5]|jgi:FKBP-type peptidyl-prolyl cis-trans isomerase|nr:MAG: hypothetical protein CVU10_09625 [Bacteroidetes bacterium HGW-Bacteroidetes-5]
MRLSFLILSLLFLIPLSCAKEEQLNLMSQQESAIDKFVETLADSRVVVEDGVWRVVMEEGSGSGEAVAGDSLKINYAAYIFNSGKGALYDTNIKSVANEAGLEMDFDFMQPKWVVVGKGKLLSGMDRGLISVKKGERCYVIFSARHGFGNTQIGLVPKMSPLLIEVWVLDVKKN